MNQGETVTITATTDGTEDIQWISSDETIAIVEGTGEGKRIAMVTAMEAGTVTITAQGKNTSKTCTITIKSPHIDDSYVEYDVSYTDIETETEYSSKTGWRLLTQEEKEDGKYNIEIISTGIPAGLY